MRPEAAVTPAAARLFMITCDPVQVQIVHTDE